MVIYTCSDFANKCHTEPLLLQVGPVAPKFLSFLGV